MVFAGCRKSLYIALKRFVSILFPPSVCLSQYNVSDH